MEENLCYDLKPARKAFSRVGWALNTVLVATVVLSLVLDIVLGILIERGILSPQSTVLMWLQIILPLYLAFLVGLLILRTVPAQAPERNKMGVKEFLKFLPICFFLSYAGSYAGDLLSAILSGGSAENTVADLAMDTSPLKVLYMVILAPLVEEYIFRKQIIDRTVRYGEKVAVLFSALTFGLFHGNLFQFPYAFLVGGVLAYVYIRTGCLRYTVLYHCIFNFMGAVVAPFVLSLMDEQALLVLESGVVNAEYLAAFSKMLPAMIISILYTFLILGLMISGLVLLILQLPKLVWKETQAQLPRGTGGKTAYLNVGMCVFFLLSIVQFVLALM